MSETLPNRAKRRNKQFKFVANRALATLFCSATAVGNAGSAARMSTLTGGESHFGKEKSKMRVERAGCSPFLASLLLLIAAGATETHNVTPIVLWHGMGKCSSISLKVRLCLHTLGQRRSGRGASENSAGISLFLRKNRHILGESDLLMSCF